MDLLTTSSLSLSGTNPRTTQHYHHANDPHTYTATKNSAAHRATVVAANPAPKPIRVLANHPQPLLPSPIPNHHTDETDDDENDDGTISLTDPTLLPPLHRLPDADPIATCLRPSTTFLPPTIATCCRTVHYASDDENNAYGDSVCRSGEGDGVDELHAPAHVACASSCNWLNVSSGGPARSGWSHTGPMGSEGVHDAGGMTGCRPRPPPKLRERPVRVESGSIDSLRRRRCRRHRRRHAALLVSKWMTCAQRLPSTLGGILLKSKIPTRDASLHNNGRGCADAARQQEGVETGRGGLNEKRSWAKSVCNAVLFALARHELRRSTAM